MTTKPSSQKQPSKLNVKAEEYRSIRNSGNSYNYPQTELVASLLQGLGVKQEIKPKDDVSCKIIPPKQPERQRKIFKDKIDSISTDDLLTVSFVSLFLLVKLHSVAPN